MGLSGPTVSECSWLATGIPASVVVRGLRSLSWVISTPPLEALVASESTLQCELGLAFL
jgi:predicted lipoprotein